MKYLIKLFALADRQSNRHNKQQQRQTSDTRLTPTLHAVTLVPKLRQSDAALAATTNTTTNTNTQSKISILAYDEPVKQTSQKQQSADRFTLAERESHRLAEQQEQQRQESSPASYWFLTATIGETIASTLDVTSAAKLAASGSANDHDNQNHHYHFYDQGSIPNLDNEISAIVGGNSHEDNDDGDWVLVDSSTTSRQQRWRNSLKEENSPVKATTKLQLQLQQMALDANSIELVKASWIPVRRDPVASGVLLFKGLFTKFPQYLKFFPQFADVDLECLQKHKRLLRHALKVVETVTFVVDSVGDESKGSQLEAALVSLVRGHLKRQIGLAEFRNLGIVLIDFICDVNNRRSSTSLSASRRSSDKCGQLNKSSTSDSSNHSSYDSETMTSALDKIRASISPSSSSEEESSYLSISSRATELNESSYTPGETTTRANRIADARLHHDDDESKLMMANDKEQLRDTSSSEADCNNEAKIDTNLLVAAWTKLYSSILDLVKREEANSSD